MLRTHLNLVRVPITIGLFVGISTTPVTAQETGADAGEVTFTITLDGPVDDRDGFLVVIDCADEWCDDETIDPAQPDGKIVIACGQGWADAPTCAAGAYDFTVDLATGPMDYWFFRIRDLLGDSEWQLQHHGTWQIHGGHQEISLGYVYGGVPAPLLPDTALPAP